MNESLWRAFFDAIVSLMVDSEMSINDISIMVCIISIVGTCFFVKNSQSTTALGDFG